MEQTKDRLNNGAVKKILVNRRRISSDTAIIHAPKKLNMSRIKTSVRLPLQDLSCNVTSIAKLNENQTLQTEDSVRTIASGFISKVTEKRLKARETDKSVGSSPQKVVSKTTNKRSSVSSNTKTIITKSYVNLPKPELKLSKGKSTIFEQNGTVALQDATKRLKKPARKVTLCHKLPNRQKKRRSEAYVLDIYTTEYLEDIIKCQLTNDWKFVLKPNSLKKYNDQFRASLIQALSRVIEYFEQPSSILFATVRLFDYILDSRDIPLNFIQLISYIIMWIIIKFDNNTTSISARRLADVCNNLYTVSDILQLERKLLKFLDFNLIMSDVTVFINFYIVKLRETNEHLQNSVEYILECLTHNKKFSMITPSKQAAGAVCLALDILQPESSSWRTLGNTFGFYHHNELKEIMQLMLEQVHKIQDPSYEYRFSYEKYATKEKKQVSVVLLKKLIGS